MMKVLLAEDEQSIRRGVETYLQNNNFEVTTASNGALASEKLKSEYFDLLITDINMPDKNGIELLKELRTNKNNIPIIIFTAFGSVENAVEAMKLGADDYLLKPLNLFELRMRIDKVLKKSNLEKENSHLKKLLETKNKYELIGNSSKMIELKNLITKIGNDYTINILISGESGTGKELVAHNMHLQSERNLKPFISVNCAAISPELFESELFGHTAGSFTGANTKREGLFLAANDGTLFLDEIAELPLPMQAKLLRVLQENKVRPVGSDAEIKIDTRVICATNKNLEELVKLNKFREDLYYRLNVIEVNVPGLKERKDDIPYLVEHFLTQCNNNHVFSEEALDTLVEYHWPGNIRELENTIKKISVTCDTHIISKYDLPENILSSTTISNLNSQNYLKESDFQESVKKVIAAFEKEYIQYHLNKNNGNISKTTDSIGLSRVSLHKKIKDYKIKINNLR